MEETRKWVYALLIIGCRMANAEEAQEVLGISLESKQSDPHNQRRKGNRR